MQQLRNLEANLKKYIVGQDEAMFRRRLRHPQEPRRHQRENAARSRFIFVGSTGVGKTELVKRLRCGAVLLPWSRSSGSICPSSWKNTAVSKLIGSPPGYVGL